MAFLAFTTRTVHTQQERIQGLFFCIWISDSRHVVMPATSVDYLTRTSTVLHKKNVEKFVKLNGAKNLVMFSKKFRG